MGGIPCESHCIRTHSCHPLKLILIPKRQQRRRYPGRYRHQSVEQIHTWQVGLSIDQLCRMGVTPCREEPSPRPYHTVRIAAIWSTFNTKSRSSTTPESSRRSMRLEIDTRPHHAWRSEPTTGKCDPSWSRVPTVVLATHPFFFPMRARASIQPCCEACCGVHVNVSFVGESPRCCSTLARLCKGCLLSWVIPIMVSVIDLETVNRRNRRCAPTLRYEGPRLNLYRRNDGIRGRG